MNPTSELRERLTAAFSLAVGVIVATSLLGFSLKPVQPRDAKRIRISQGVRFSSPAPAPSVAPKVPDVVLPIQTPDAPTHKQPKKQPQPPAAVPPANVPPPSDAPTPPQVETSSYQLPPQLMSPSVAASGPAADLPMLPGAPMTASADGKPSAPPDDYLPPAQEYLEKPGGEVLVLGLLVDHTGKVLKSQVLVPSWDNLKNYTLAIIGKDITFSDVSPPLAPGETRWLEVRYVIPQTKPGILP